MVAPPTEYLKLKTKKFGNVSSGFLHTLPLKRKGISQNTLAPHLGTSANRQGPRNQKTPRKPQQKPKENQEKIGLRKPSKPLVYSNFLS